MSQENCCLDDYFPFWNCPFSGDIRSFSEGKFLSTWIASSKSFCPNMHPSLIKDWLCPENLMGNGCNFSTWWFCHLSSLDQALNTVNILEDFEVYIIFTIHTENKKQQACVSLKKKKQHSPLLRKKKGIKNVPFPNLLTPPTPKSKLLLVQSLSHTTFQGSIWSLHQGFDGVLQQLLHQLRCHAPDVWWFSKGCLMKIVQKFGCKAEALSWKSGKCPNLEVAFIISPHTSNWNCETLTDSTKASKKDKKCSQSSYLKFNQNKRRMFRSCDASSSPLVRSWLSPVWGGASC